jgi:hypothetical protein
MASPKALPTSRLVFLNCHIGITKTNSLGLVAFFGDHYELLRAARSALRLVVPAYACSG